MSDEQIGCFLADAESGPAYMNYFFEAYVSSPSLHVVYINTYLETKAHAHELVPTITCTSSNVVQTILQLWKRLRTVFSSWWLCIFSVYEGDEKMGTYLDFESVYIEPNDARYDISGFSGENEKLMKV
ncbi:hypothetical protein L1987_45794 [Smallanthus sonchifolius]|uniref:Uncharacterized protein n=1 Tax=Smallanthus sonchifolius TaxID=185202 RepID=A0ACB9FXF6_9ASTR|nr:hypothetical protein L1987_45794 [Smallanthus sonchifolius]